MKRDRKSSFRSPNPEILNDDTARCLVGPVDGRSSSADMLNADRVRSVFVPKLGSSPKPEMLNEGRACLAGTGVACKLRVCRLRRALLSLVCHCMPSRLLVWTLKEKMGAWGLELCGGRLGTGGQLPFAFVGEECWKVLGPLARFLVKAVLGVPGMNDAPDMLAYEWISSPKKLDG